MKKLLIILLFPVYCYGQQDSTRTYLREKYDSLEAAGFFGAITRIKSLHCVDQKCTIIIKQDIWFEFGKWHLLTTDGSLYDNVLHGSLEFVEAQKPIELNKALARRKPIAIVIVKCKDEIN